MPKIVGLAILAASLAIPPPGTWLGVALTLFVLGVISIATEH